MYSPKIREDLIPRIYRAAKKANIPMTVWVSQVVEESLPPVAPEPPTHQPQEEFCESSPDRSEQ